MITKIPYDSLTLRAVVDELRRIVVGGQVQNIAQPAATDLVVAIRARSATHSLLLSCDAVFARANLTQVRRANPPSPPAFCMLCRKYLEGARVTEVRQRGFDRILDIEMRGADGRAYTLIAELMGKHSNLILVNEEATILDAAKRIGKKLSRVREVLPGKPYIGPPPQENKLNPFAAGSGEVAEFLRSLPSDHEARAARWMSRFEGISPFLAEELALRSEGAGERSAERAWEEIFGAAAAGNWKSVVVRNRDSESIGAYPLQLSQVDSDMQFERESINVALDNYYSTAIPRLALDSETREMETAVARAIRSRETQKSSHVRSLEEAARAEHLRECGELLLAHLHEVEPDSDSVDVADFYAEGSIRRIPLNPAKSAGENAESYFRRYRKAKDGEAIHREQLARIDSDVAALRDALALVQRAKDAAAVREVKSDLMRRGLLRGDKEELAKGGPRLPDFNGKKIRMFRSPEGWDIYWGENSEANDYLTAKVASPNDWWLHVRANASSHVIIRTRNDPSSVPLAVIRRAAVIAAQHSAAKHSGTVPVDYTLKKYVRRPKGSPSGAALYQNEKTINVDPKQK